eukprot:TRINITY_DN15410_c0_g1_i1.p1 TRINITY_DN15410_c0_g1~~TRINITY_DN15410_c0_g1_i1.p1  ORF type:complete len:105 (-),score=60.74 TRINITY_DN15410_c0_g1_i1:21-335(-)
MIRRPPRSTQSRSSAASDVYKRQGMRDVMHDVFVHLQGIGGLDKRTEFHAEFVLGRSDFVVVLFDIHTHFTPVSYTHLRAHETVLDLVCRLLLEKKKKRTNESH